ncbi:hypothetical protein [Microvirga sp. 17 mud 1-3]|uniref:hypothetical protein n=1 Tax=Microvirga sp. 17 mud 1-3 TaxID=2082949 RepID=UPI0013A5A639|nr:hypothetical protein [Microvirga sp. 17 mud 1-3]
MNDSSVCKGSVGETEGLFTYTSNALKAYESECKIVQSTPRGTAFELLMRCESEGETFESKETVELIGGRLKRTMGRNRSTVTYSKCPEEGVQSASATTPQRLYSFDIENWGGRPVVDEQGAFKRCAAWTPVKGSQVTLGFSATEADGKELRLFVSDATFIENETYPAEIHTSGGRRPISINMIARSAKELGVSIRENPELLERLGDTGRMTAFVRGLSEGRAYNIAVPYTNISQATKAIEGCVQAYHKEAKPSAAMQASTSAPNASGQSSPSMQATKPQTPQGSSPDQELAKVYNYYLTVQWCSKPIDMGLVIVPTTLKPEQVEQAKAAMRVIDASFKEQKVDTDAVWATSSQKFSAMLAEHQKKVEPQRKLLQLSGEAPKEADAEGRLVMGLTCNAALEAILGRAGTKKEEAAAPALKKDF